MYLDPRTRENVEQDRDKRLEDAAWDHANEIRDGKFARVVGIDWEPSLREIARRVPGCTREQYQVAMSKAMLDPLW